MTPRLTFTLPPAAPEGLDSRREIPIDQIRFLLYQSRNDQTLLALEDGSRLPLRENYHAVWQSLKEAGWSPPPYRHDSQEPPPADPWQRAPAGPAEVLAIFLAQGCMRVEHHAYLMNPSRPPKHWAFGQTLTVTVNSNDVLYWGVAAHADIADAAALRQLYELWSQDPSWGTFKYACWEANMQPQPPWQDMLKEQDAWDEMLESLPANDDPSWDPEEPDEAEDDTDESPVPPEPVPATSEPAPAPN